MGKQQETKCCHGSGTKSKRCSYAPIQQEQAAQLVTTAMELGGLCTPWVWVPNRFCSVHPSRGRTLRAYCSCTLRNASCSCRTPRSCCAPSSAAPAFSRMFSCTTSQMLLSGADAGVRCRWQVPEGRCYLAQSRHVAHDPLHRPLLAPGAGALAGWSMHTSTPLPLSGSHAPATYHFQHTTVHNLQVCAAAHANITNNRITPRVRSSAAATSRPSTTLASSDSLACSCSSSCSAM